MGFYINGVNPEDYGVLPLREYSVGGTAITNTTFQGRNRSSYRLLAAVYAQKPISLTMVYPGKTYREAALLRSTVESWMWGKIEICLPDGFYYTATLSSIDEGTPEGQDDNQVLISVGYSFTGIQHDPLVTVQNAAAGFWNPGTLPFADCICSVIASAAADTYRLAGATFQNVQQGEQLTVDGINGRLLRNGAPAPGNVTFVSFPQVTPGQNAFSAADPVTVQFYPCYI